MTILSEPLPIPFEELPTPCYVVDERLIKNNLGIIETVQQRTGAKVILALKGFAMFSVFPLIREYLCGTTASSLNEARLGKNEFGKEVHVYAVAYRDSEMDELIQIASHLVWNSFSQWQRFREKAKQAPHLRCGIRINPEYSEVPVDLYNPCKPGSQFGMDRKAFDRQELDGISGLHFHTLCEQNSDVLERTLDVVAEQFGPWLSNMEWINMGGGHQISRPDYDVDRMCRTIDRFKKQFHVEIYLEPGEAIVLNAGYLVASVLDLFDNELNVAILDTSATAHMPDVLEMPYRPEILGARQPGESAYTYRLCGLSCLAGDIVGDYSFSEPLQIGSRLVFTDMAHYTMVKNTTFNGVGLPAIAKVGAEGGEVEIVREFSYDSYRSRLS